MDHVSQLSPGKYHTPPASSTAFMNFGEVISSILNVVQSEQPAAPGMQAKDSTDNRILNRFIVNRFKLFDNV
jgi:hypothetical protein